MPEPIARVVRSWATVEIRSVDKSKRAIEGVASTPSLDRTNWIVEPLGVEFRNPVPLLWQHDAKLPVGIARLDKPTKSGVTFSATIPKIEQAGTLKDRTDEAWQMIEAGLVRGVSIGFKPIETEFDEVDDEFAVRFKRSEVLELSLVTVPANAEATITAIRSIDAASQARTGNGDARGKAAPAATAQPVMRIRQMPIPLNEQIAAWQAKVTAATDRQKAIMDKAAETGSTLDEAEAREYDDLGIEAQRLKEHLARLVDMDRIARETVVPVNGGDPIAAAQSREVTPYVATPAPAAINGGMLLPPQASQPRISLRRQVPPGIPFVRLVAALTAARGNWQLAAQHARRQIHWRSETPEVETVLSSDIDYLWRAPVPPAGTGVIGDSTWAGPLVVAQNMASEFAEFLRPLTILGRIPGLRRVPFNISLPRQTAGTSVGWVGEGAPKPLTQGAFDTISLRWAKAAAIVAMTEELVRFSNPAAESVIRQDLANAMTFFLDRQFLDPSVAAVANVSPASVSNGVTPVTPTGTTMAAFRADVKTLFGNIFAANLNTTGGAWVMTQQQALALSLAQNSLGQEVFPTVSAERGGTLMGYPVIQSENIASTTGSPADGFPIFFLIAPEIMLADDGQITIDASREASLQMESAPDSPPTASTNMVSLWQTNMIGLKAERFINWLKRRAGAVQFIAGAKYAE